MDRNNALLGRPAGESTVLAILGAISFCHLLNDMLQSLLPAIYPMLKTAFNLDFSHIGLLTLTYQATASILQPLVGLYTDHRPKTHALAVGMTFTLAGLLLLAGAGSFTMLLSAAALMGIGSSIFHPESSRVARLASGGHHGLAQSLFQVGGNVGSAVGPLLAAFFVLEHGRGSIAWFALAALLGIVLLWTVGTWYRDRRRATSGSGSRAAEVPHLLSRRKVG
ncbi:MAG TPA: MFS transporter, partial [Alphaproteobacteria bacterium]|nr:MFS transporter [Alphaproteobacteria bacterium]